MVFDKRTRANFGVLGSLATLAGLFFSQNLVIVLLIAVVVAGLVSYAVHQRRLPAFSTLNTKWHLELSSNGDAKLVLST